MKLNEVFRDLSDVPDDVVADWKAERRANRSRAGHDAYPNYWDDPEVSDEDTDDELNQAITALNIAKQNARFHTSQAKDSRVPPERQEQHRLKAEKLLKKVAAIEHDIEHWNDTEEDCEM